MGKAVIVDFEEGVGGELLENSRIGIDPASADKEGGGDLFRPEIFDERGVVATAPRAAAGVEGQRDDLLGGVELCLDAGYPLAPIRRLLVFVGGDEPLLRGGCRGLRSRWCRGLSRGRCRGLNIGVADLLADDRCGRGRFRGRRRWLRLLDGPLFHGKLDRPGPCCKHKAKG